MAAQGSGGGRRRSTPRTRPALAPRLAAPQLRVLWCGPCAPTQTPLDASCSLKPAAPGSEGGCKVPREVAWRQAVACGAMGLLQTRSAAAVPIACVRLQSGRNSACHRISAACQALDPWVAAGVTKSLASVNAVRCGPLLHRLMAASHEAPARRPCARIAWPAAESCLLNRFPALIIRPITRGTPTFRPRAC